MEKDFHYYCVAVVAKAAGFLKEDALTIAYASQYVDNSTESEPIRVGELMFDPVRTAHFGLKALDWSIQKRVFIPFHFVPPNPIRSPNDTFITAPNSPFALRMLHDANEEPQQLRRLCRVGVALHTLADTWAHQGFSGRDHKENDVESIYHLKGRTWKHLLSENFLLDFLPEIGHAEAGSFPDQSFLIWKWKYAREQAEEEHFQERNNPNEFMKAAENIYRQLVPLNKRRSDQPIPWSELKDGIRELLADKKEKEIDKRCEKWRGEFGGMFDPLTYGYDSRTWRNEALEPRNEADTDWDALKPSDFRHLQFPMTPGFYDSAWVQFHRAALRQRHFVLENLL